MPEFQAPPWDGYVCIPANYQDSGSLRGLSANGWAVWIALHAWRMRLRGKLPSPIIPEDFLQSGHLASRAPWRMHHVQAVAGLAEVKRVGLLVEVLDEQGASKGWATVEQVASNPLSTERQARRKAAELRRSGADSPRTVRGQMRTSADIGGSRARVYTDTDTDTDRVGSDPVGQDPDRSRDDESRPAVVHPPARPIPTDRCTATTSQGRPCTCRRLDGRDVCGVHARLVIPPETLEGAAAVLARHWQVLGLAGQPTDRQRRDLGKVMVETGLDATALCRVVDYLGSTPWNRAPDGSPIPRPASWTYSDPDRLQRWLHEAAAPTSAPVVPTTDPETERAIDETVAAHAKAFARHGQPTPRARAAIAACLRSGMSADDCYHAVYGARHAKEWAWQRDNGKFTLLDIFGDPDKAQAVATLGRQAYRFTGQRLEGDDAIAGYGT